MCLYFNSDSLVKTKLQKQTNAGQTVIRYKVVRPSRGKFVTPYRGTKCTKRLISDRLSDEATSYENYNRRISQGIHVCTTIERAKYIQFMIKDCNNRFTPGNIDVIKEVKCKIDDLVMISDYGNEEVYTKVEFVDLYGKKNKVNWTNVLNVDAVAVRNFAAGYVSKDAFLNSLSGSSEYTAVRKLVRERGADEVRTLARKALRRRSLV